MIESVVVPQRRWCNRPLTRERDEQRVRLLWRTLLAIVVAFVPTGAYLVQQAQCVQLSYRANELRARIETLDREERRLATQLASLQSFERIERWAEANGLARPEAERVFILTDDEAPPDGSLLARQQPTPARRGAF